MRRSACAMTSPRSVNGAIVPSPAPASQVRFGWLSLTSLVAPIGQNGVDIRIEVGPDRCHDGRSTGQDERRRLARGPCSREGRLQAVGEILERCRGRYSINRMSIRSASAGSASPGTPTICSPTPAAFTAELGELARPGCRARRSHRSAAAAGSGKPRPAAPPPGLASTSSPDRRRTATPRQGRPPDRGHRKTPSISAAVSTTAPVTPPRPPDTRGRASV